MIEMANKFRNLYKFVIDHITKNGNLFFPDGIYGGSAYLLDEEGFFGPLHIHTYIVPASFSESAKQKFMIRLNNAGLSLDSELGEPLVQADGLNLSYGEGWELEPEEFVGMLLAGCVANTPYLIPPDYEYEDFEDFIEGALYADNVYMEWGELGKEEVEVWIEMLENKD